MTSTQTIISLIVFTVFIITIPIILVLLYIGWLYFKSWILRKITLFIIATKLICAKHKAIRAIGWSTLSIVFWEVKE